MRPRLLRFPRPILPLMPLLFWPRSLPPLLPLFPSLPILLPPYRLLLSVNLQRPRALLLLLPLLILLVLLSPTYPATSRILFPPLILFSPRLFQLLPRLRPRLLLPPPLLRAGGFRRSRDLGCPIEPSLGMGLCELAPLGFSSARVPPTRKRASLRCASLPLIHACRPLR